MASGQDPQWTQLHQFASSVPQHSTPMRRFADELYAIWKSRVGRWFEHYMKSGEKYSARPTAGFWVVSPSTNTPTSWAPKMMSQYISVQPEKAPQEIFHFLDRLLDQFGRTPLHVALVVLGGMASYGYLFCMGCGQFKRVALSFQGLSTGLPPNFWYEPMTSSMKTEAAQLVAMISPEDWLGAAGLCSGCKKMCSECGAQTPTRWDKATFLTMKTTGVCAVCGADRLENLRPTKPTKQQLMGLRGRFLSLPGGRLRE